MADAQISFAFTYDQVQLVTDQEEAYRLLRAGLGELSVLAASTRGMAWTQEAGKSEARASLEFADQSLLHVHVKQSFAWPFNTGYHPDDIVRVNFQSSHLDSRYPARNVYYGIRLGERAVRCKTTLDYEQRVDAAETILAKIEAAGMSDKAMFDFSQMLELEAALRNQHLDPDAHEEVARWRDENPLYREASDLIRNSLLGDTMEQHLGMQRGERDAEAAEVRLLLNFLQRLQMGNGLVEGSI